MDCVGVIEVLVLPLMKLSLCLSGLLTRRVLHLLN